MSFEIIQVQTMPGGNIKARCTKCGDEEFIYPAMISDSSPVINSSMQVSHTCRLRDGMR